MSIATRRRFLQRLGLTAIGTPLAYGIGRSILERSAAARTGRRRIGIFVALGEGAPIYEPHSYVPEGFVEFDDSGEPRTGYYEGVDTTEYPWPTLLASFAPYRQNMLLVDGLKMDMNKASANHGYDYALLSGVGNYQNELRFGEVLAQSIDQYVARNIQADAPLSSLLFGMEGAGMVDSRAATFANGKNQPLAHAGRPSVLLDRITGHSGSGSATAEAAKLRTRMLDIAREDLNRLRQGLASPERVMLDDYEAAILNYDKEQQALAEALGSCDTEGLEGLEDDPRDRFQSMANIGLVALNCGLTNVLGISIGQGGAHDDLKVFNNPDWGNYGGHAGREGYGPFIQKLWDFVLGEIAKMIDALSPVADVTAVIVPTNGATKGGHHSDGERMSAIVYDNSGTLTTGGRYFRFQAIKNANTQRHLADVYTTLAHAFSAPVDRFNDAGAGPIGELLT